MFKGRNRCIHFNSPVYVFKLQILFILGPAILGVLFATLGYGHSNLDKNGTSTFLHNLYTLDFDQFNDIHPDTIKVGTVSSCYYPTYYLQVAIDSRLSPAKVHRKLPAVSKELSLVTAS